MVIKESTDSPVGVVVVRKKKRNASAAARLDSLGPRTRRRARSRWWLRLKEAACRICVASAKQKPSGEQSRGNRGRRVPAQEAGRCTANASSPRRARRECQSSKAVIPHGIAAPAAASCAARTLLFCWMASCLHVETVFTEIHR